MTEEFRKAGDTKREDGKIYVWVICPDCDYGRWTLRKYTRGIMYTGRCKPCYLKVARNDFR